MKHLGDTIIEALPKTQLGLQIAVRVAGCNQVLDLVTASNQICSWSGYSIQPDLQLIWLQHPTRSAIDMVTGANHISWIWLQEPTLSAFDLVTASNQIWNWYGYSSLTTSQTKLQQPEHVSRVSDWACAGSTSFNSAMTSASRSGHQLQSQPLHLATSCGHCSCP